MSDIALAPSVYSRICKSAVDIYDQRFLAEIFAQIPTRFCHEFLREYEHRLASSGRRSANLYALSLKNEILPELFADTALPFQASDSDIIEAAERAAVRACKCVLSPTKETMLTALGRLARSYRVAMPVCKTDQGISARMVEPAWWRRALRKRFRHVEHAAIRAGFVRGNSPYVTDEALCRYQHHAKRTAKLMESMDATNQTTGETIQLSKIVEGSLANPANRRAAVMVQIRGMESYAESLGYVGYFVTLTCPSRMHAYHKKSGRPVENYDGTSPRKAQCYLGRVWNSGMRKLKRDGITCMGIRTVEPHHDATPHWHVVIFVDPTHASALLATLREYAHTTAQMSRARKQSGLTQSL
ncbi:MAG: replication endonuclease [Rhodocyclaceae bacterium]|nr:replication endonuclease [Rhodocyclaceae bacterium]